MALTPSQARKDLKRRMRSDRLQAKPGGGFQLPSRRGGPLVKPPHDERFNYDEFHKEGFQVWKNKKNGFCVVRWHYTEDPAKRDPSFEAEGRAKNPQGWDQEMEIDFRSKKGVKAFSEFPWTLAECDLGPFWSSRSNVILPTEKPPAWWPLYLATDPGRNRCWATLIVLVDEYGCWHVTGSVVRPGMHYTEAKRHIAAILGKRRPVEHVIDPASKQERTDSTRTLLEKMAQPPFPMLCTPPAHRSNEYIGLEELRERMMQRDDGRYGMYFWDIPANQMCIDQFRNAVYKDDYGERLDEIDVDAVDAGRYLATHLTGRAIRPKKPLDTLTNEERQVRRVSLRRRKIERDAEMQQRARLSSQADDLDFDTGGY